MKLHIETLERYHSGLPKDRRILRDLLDDLGIEVKRVQNGIWGEVFTLELLANRGDHHCYFGIAREIEGRLGGGLQPVVTKSLPVGSCPLEVKITTDKCLAYCLTVVKFDSPPAQSLPKEWLAPLQVDDVQADHIIIDVTNWVNLELGQPLHAFDLDKICGTLTVRSSRDEEEVQLLSDSAPRRLPAGTLVIADDAGVLAVAGVMGGARAKVTSATKRVALESALFDPVSVRLAAKQLKINSLASQRFERGGDLAMVAKGAERALDLWHEFTAGKREGGSFYWENQKNLPLRSPLPLAVHDVQQYLSLPIAQDEVIARLARYGFHAEIANSTSSSSNLWVTVPSHRLWDVSTVPCLYEELAKSIGYNQIAATIPPNCRGSLPSLAERSRQLIEEILVNAGFYEVVVDGFYGRNQLAKLGIGNNDTLNQHIETSNSLDKSFSLLKNNGLLQALEIAETASCFGNNLVKVFEFTRLFIPSSTPGTYCQELPIVWGLLWGNEQEKFWDRPSTKTGIWYFKGLLTEMAHSLRLKINFSYGFNKNAAISSKLHPKEQFAVHDEQGKQIGICGSLHPQYLGNYKIGKTRPFYFELHTEAWYQREVAPIDEDDLPQFQPIKRNVSFHIPPSVHNGDIVDMLKKTGSQQLSAIHVVDSFMKSRTPTSEAVHSFTFELIFNNDNKISSDEINLHVDSLIQKVLANFSAQGVQQR